MDDFSTSDATNVEILSYESDYSDNLSSSAFRRDHRFAQPSGRHDDLSNSTQAPPQHALAPAAAESALGTANESAAAPMVIGFFDTAEIRHATQPQKIIAIMATSFGQRIADEIWDIYKISHQRIMGRTRMSLKNLKRTCEFLIENNSIPTPGFLLTADGNIQLEWYESDQRHAIAEVTDFNVKFAIISDGSEYGGIVPHKGLANQLKSADVSKWNLEQ